MHTFTYSSIVILICVFFVSSLEVSLSSSANEMPTAKQIVDIASEAAVHVRKGELVAHLDPDLFTTDSITATQREQNTEFERTRAMLEKWCNAGQATCRKMIEALLTMKLKRIACEVFGEQLVGYIISLGIKTTK